MDTEVWKDIPGYEGLYRVSNTWKVESLNYNHTGKSKILKFNKINCGYLLVQLYNLNWKKVFLVHRIVAFTFIPNPENKPEVNHKNWVKTDNRLENLEWNTYSENLKHAYRVLWKVSPSKGMFWKDSMNKVWVIQFDLFWNKIKEWDCIRDIQRELWIKSQNIWRCCRLGASKTAWWFIWRYL